MSELACPKCNETLHIDIAAAVGAKQRFSYRVYPSDSNMMQAKAIGGQLVAMDDLMRAVAREDGAKVRTYIHKVETHPDASLEFFLVVLPVVAWDEKKGKFVNKTKAAIAAASVDERPEGQDAEERLGAQPASAVPATPGDAQTTPGAIS